MRSYFPDTFMNIYVTFWYIQACVKRYGTYGWGHFACAAIAVEPEYTSAAVIIILAPFLWGLVAY